MAQDRYKNTITRNQFLKLCGAGTLGYSLTGTGLCPRPASARTAFSSQVADRGFVNPQRSPWFKQLKGKDLECQLCPNQCRLEPGQRSICRVRENRDGRGYTLAFGNPALVQEDPVERKPFFHVVPGSRALSVSTAGCNLSCKFCQVWDMALVKPEQVHAYDMSPRDVVDQARSAGVRSVCFAYGEPVIFYEYMTHIARAAKEAGMLNLIHTGGYIRPAPLKELCRIIDAANVDLKGFDPAFYREYVGGEMKNVQETLVQMKKSGVHVEVTTIVIPTLNDHPRKISEMCSWIVRELGADTPLHFARFYPLYRLSGLPRTPVSTLDMAREKAMEAGLDYVYVAKVTGHEAENTFCPGCGEKIIGRLGFIVDQIRMSGGQCDSCGRAVPGIWS